MRAFIVVSGFLITFVYVITLSDQPSYFLSDPGERCLSTDHFSGYALRSLQCSNEFSPQLTDRLNYVSGNELFLKKTNIRYFNFGHSQLFEMRNFKTLSTETAFLPLVGQGSKFQPVQNLGKAAHHQPYPGLLLCSAVREIGLLLYFEYISYFILFVTKRQLRL